MARCDECKANKVCDHNRFGFENCGNFIPYDVAPKSEVERLETEVRLLTENSISAKYPCRVLCSKGLILTKSLEEYDKLLADISSEVAREIFEEIEKLLITNDFEKHYGYPVIAYNHFGYAELKKKYTEDQNNENQNQT